MALWADALYAMDRNWWKHYLPDVHKRFAGLRYTCNRIQGVTSVKPISPGNSGAGAIFLAARNGARRILLLGYDCKVKPGKPHWHGKHPIGLGNCGSLPLWPGHFAKVAAELAGVEIINCSRETAIKCFPRMSLEEALDCRSGSLLAAAQVAADRPQGRGEAVRG